MNAILPRTALVLRGETAADLMAANPISIRADAGLHEALLLFTDKGIAAAPVINDAGHPIGVLSRSDMLVHQREQIGEHAGFFFDASLETPGRSAPTERPAKVADLMTPAVFSVAPSTPAARVVEEMLALRVHRMFVVDADGTLIGVVSSMDILKALGPWVPE